MRCRRRQGSAAARPHPDLHIVSRAEQEDAIRKMQRAGATRVISPIRSGGVSIVNSILKPNLADLLDRTHDRGEDFELAEITVEAGSALDGSTTPGNRSSPRVVDSGRRTMDGGHINVNETEAIHGRADRSEAAGGGG